MYIVQYLQQCLGSSSFWFGSGSGDPLPGIVDPDTIQHFFRFFFCKRYNTRNIFLSLFMSYTCNSCVLNKKSDFLKKKKYILIILVDFYVSLSQFFCTTDSDPRFLKRIRIRPNDMDPAGSETLSYKVHNMEQNNNIKSILLA